MTDAIGPGQEKTFNVKFSWYNFQYAGGTSEPKVEVEVTSYEW